MSALKTVSSEGSEKPFFSAPVRGEVEAQLEDLKGRLLRPILEKVRDSALSREILWAANEAAALAWCTVCPVLMLPLLLEEKVRAAMQKWEKQQQVKADVFKRHACSRIGASLLIAAA